MQSPLAVPDAWNLVAPGYAAEVVPLFTRFAEDALRLAEPPRGAAIVDVATGPGTLACLAARTASRVAALDFSAEMIAQLEARRAREDLANVEPRVGDGMALPYEDASFDAGFSMFGLMFFPDRHRGLTELRRALRPAAPAVIASWQPAPAGSLFDETMRAVREELPHLPFGNGKAPLGEAAEAEAELAAAGFRDVRVVTAVHVEQLPDLGAYARTLDRSTAPIALLKARMPPEAFAAFQEGIAKRLVARLGPGPVDLELRANLALGRA